MGLLSFLVSNRFILAIWLLPASLVYDVFWYLKSQFILSPSVKKTLECIFTSSQIVPPHRKKCHPLQMYHYQTMTIVITIIFAIM